MATKPKTDLEGIISEIIAGKAMVPRNELDKTWNQALDRAVSIVRNYQNGLGIFQIGTERSKFKAELDICMESREDNGE